MTGFQWLFVTLVSLAMGVGFIAAILFGWKRIPAGNEPFGFAFIAFGLAGVLHGMYKLYGLRQ